MNIFGWVATTIIIFNVIFFGILWLIFWVNDYEDYKRLHPKKKKQRKD